MSELDNLREDRRRLAADLKMVIVDAENILRQKVDNSGVGYTEARERLEHTVESIKGELRHAERAVLESSREALESTEKYVRRHPFESIGVGIGVGLLVGLVVGRK